MTASGLTLDSAISSWERALRARNRSPRTIRSYIDTARLLEDFLRVHRMPRRVGVISAEQIELLIDDQLRRWRPRRKREHSDASVGLRRTWRAG
jgi:hypothetical protein